jgi:chromosomal replication initiation ATPase DnaA
MSVGEASRRSVGGDIDGFSEAAGQWGHSHDMAVHFVESLVASAFGFRPDDLRTASRGRARVALARQIAIYLVHTRLGLSFSRAGEIFGRDRTTAAHACRTVENDRDDPGFDTMIDCLERSVDLWPGFSEPEANEVR